MRLTPLLPVPHGACARPLAVIGGIYVLPVVLLATRIIPFRWRFQVLIGMAAVAAWLAFPRHSRDSLGLSLPRLRAFLMWAVLPAAGLIGLILVADLPRRLVTPEHLTFYAFFVFVSAPAQEFLYRAFLFAELGALQIPARAIVALSAVLFGFMHIIYRDLPTVLVTLAAGLLWAVVFHATRKIWIVTLSHAALGVAAISAGLV